MSSYTIALFDDREQAREAVRHVEMASTPAIESGRFRDNKMPAAATRVSRWSLVGGLIVGFAGLFMFSIAFAPLLDIQLTAMDAVMIGVAGGIFGMIAGAISGLTMADARLEPLRRAVEEGGKTAVVLDASDASEQVHAKLRRYGAVTVQTV